MKATSLGEPERRRLSRQARRAGLWRLHRRVVVVAETPAGRPVISVGSARLVLANSGRFHWLLSCHSCGGDVEWGLVTKPRDLLRPPGPRLCDRHTAF